jgi:uncharacterized DUF497 family protein
VDFEWDEEKRRENIEKHGLDFVDACEIFDAPMLTVSDTREDYGEDRWIGVGFLRNFVAVVVHTVRVAETIRIISKPSETNWTRVSEMTDEEIDTSDIPPLDETFFANARLRVPA